MQPYYSDKYINYIEHIEYVENVQYFELISISKEL